MITIAIVVSRSSKLLLLWLLLLKERRNGVRIHLHHANTITSNTTNSNTTRNSTRSRCIIIVNKQTYPKERRKKQWISNKTQYQINGIPNYEQPLRGRNNHLCYLLLAILALMYTPTERVSFNGIIVTGFDGKNTMDHVFLNTYWQS